MIGRERDKDGEGGQLPTAAAAYSLRIGKEHIEIWLLVR